MRRTAPPTRHTPLTRAATALVGGAATVVLLASPALAHVTVSSTSAVQGGYAELTFRVPTEKDVPTTSLQVAFPAAQPLASVSVKPHPGWTFTTTTAAPPSALSDDDGPVDSVVTGITWTATAGGIAPGEYDDFDVSVGPLPTTASMEFKAVQTYADGSVVRWIEEKAPDGSEPDTPAPVLQLASASGPTSASTPAASSVSTPTVTGTAAASPSSKGGNGLAITGIVIGAVAAALALLALLRPRRGPAA